MRNEYVRRAKKAQKKNEEAASVHNSKIFPQLRESLDSIDKNDPRNSKVMEAIRNLDSNVQIIEKYRKRPATQ